MNINKLKGKIRECGLTVAEAAEKIGISPTSFHRKANGCTEFTRGEIEKVSELLNLSNEEVISIFFAD